MSHLKEWTIKGKPGWGNRQERSSWGCFVVSAEVGILKEYFNLELHWV